MAHEHIDNAEKINGKKYRVYPGQKEPFTEFDFYSRTFMPQGTVFEEYDTCHEVAEVVVADKEKYEVEALPAQGVQVQAGEVYVYGEDIYMVRVAHAVTGNNPEDEVPELYTVVRPNPVALGWMAGEKVEKGTERKYQGNNIYVCHIAHVTTRGLEPDTAWPEETLPYWTLKA